MNKFKVGDNIVYTKSNGDILHGTIIYINKLYTYPYLVTFDTADYGMELLDMMCDDYLRKFAPKELFEKYGRKYVCWMDGDRFTIKVKENNKQAGNVKMNSEEKFFKLINTYLNNVEGIDDLCTWLTRQDFFIAPASTKYHGNYKGGLCEHSVNVCECSVKLLNSEPFKGMNIDITSVVLTALFHDVCKVNYYSVATRNVKNEETGKWEKAPYYTVKDKFPAGHGEKSVMLIQRYVKLNPDEIMAINWHMGFSDNRAKDSLGMSQISQAFKQYPLAFLLHTADMIATYYLDVED